MLLKDLKERCVEVVDDYPHLHEQIEELYEIARDEVAEGGSEDHECKLAKSDLDELIENEKRSKRQ